MMMPDYQIKYKLDDTIQVFSVSAVDELSAGKRFSELSPNIASDDILSVVRIDSGSSSANLFIEDLFYGNFGLAMTYWVYGVLGGIVWAVGIRSLGMDQESDEFKFTLFAFAAYYVLVYAGIWNAATKFSGSKVWSILAKFMVVIVAVPSVIHIFKWLNGD
jgi:hypothetical protein